MKERTIVVKQGSFGSFLRGMMVGAVIALLFAPRSGQETRDMLNQKSGELKDRAMDMANETRDRAQNAISDAKNKIQDTVKSAQDTVKSAVKSSDSGESKEELEREVTILEDINNPNYPS